MATTQKGIYYPDDYTAIADIPEDMKDLAESVDTALGDLEDNIEQNIQPQIDDIEEEQTTQNNNIEALQIENARLKATLPTTTGSGENITLQNTAELEFIQPPLPRGNSKQVQTTQSANLFDEEYYNNDSLYSVNIYKYTQTKIKGNGTLYIKAQLKSGKTAVSNLYVCLSSEQNPNISGAQFKFFIYNGDSGANVQNFTTGTNLYFCFYKTGDADVSTNAIFDNYNLWVSTDDINYTPFVPNSPSPDYPQAISNVTGDVEVLVGNGINILNMEKYAIENSTYFTYSSNTGLTAIAKDNRATANVGYPMTVTAGTTYYVKADTDKRILVSQYNSNNVWILNNEVYNGDYFVANNNASYIRVKIADTLTTFPTIIGNVYITTSNDYKEQTLPLTLGDIELCKIGMAQDYFYKDSGKWYLYKAINKVMLNGSENWLFYQNNIFYTLFSNYPAFLQSSAINEMSDNYICLISSASASEFESIASSYQYALNFHNSSQYIRIKDTRFSTASEFKTSLASNNVPLYYVLATPTSTEITDTTLISQLDAISNAISYEEQTNISGTSDESNPLFSVEAYQSIKLILAS